MNFDKDKNDGEKISFINFLVNNTIPALNYILSKNDYYQSKEIKDIFIYLRNINIITELILALTYIKRNMGEKYTTYG